MRIPRGFWRTEGKWGAMKVTNQMIHKDVRFMGAILRKFTSGMTAERFLKAHQNELRTADKKKPRTAKMEKIYLERPDGSKMRTVILKPDHEVKDVPVVLWLHGGGYVLGFRKMSWDLWKNS